MLNTDELMKNGIIFDAKPDAVPYNYRISYKVSIICLLIYKCCGRRGCSLIKMHIIAAALADSRFYNKLMKFLNFHLYYEFIVRFDPALNRALEYALSDELIVQQGNGTYKLSVKGKELTKIISGDEEVLRNEKNILDEISLKLSEERIKEISERWKYSNV
ncbi:MAG: hypothetical protein NC434_03730 [Ruminococcus sp.]|nr:hypothetical protein [Ruminococcus sp.]